MLCNHTCWRVLREENVVEFWKCRFEVCPVLRCQLEDEASSRSHGVMNMGFMELKRSSWYKEWCVAVTRRARRTQDQEYQWLRQQNLFASPISLISTFLQPCPPSMEQMELLKWLLLEREPSSELSDHRAHSPTHRKRTLELGETLAQLPSDQAKDWVTQVLGVKFVMAHLTAGGVFDLLRRGRFDLLDLLPWDQPSDLADELNVGGLIESAFYETDSMTIIQWVWKIFPKWKGFKNPHSFLKQSSFHFISTPAHFEGLMTLMDASRTNTRHPCPFFRPSTFKITFCCRLFMRLLCGSVCLEPQEEVLIDQRMCRFFDSHLASKVTKLQPSELSCPLTTEFQQLIWWVHNNSEKIIFRYLPFPQLIARLKSVTFPNTDHLVHLQWPLEMVLLSRVMLSDKIFHLLASDDWLIDLQRPLITLLMATNSLLDRTEQQRDLMNPRYPQIMEHWHRVLDTTMEMLLTQKPWKSDLECQNALFHFAFIYPSVMRRFIRLAPRPSFTFLDQSSFFLCPFCNQFNSRDPVVGTRHPLLTCLQQIQDNLALHPRYYNDLMLRRSECLEIWMEKNQPPCWVWCALQHELLVAQPQPQIDQWFLTLVKTMCRFLDSGVTIPLWTLADRQTMEEKLWGFNPTGASSKQFIHWVKELRNKLVEDPALPVLDS